MPKHHELQLMLVNTLRKVGVTKLSTLRGSWAHFYAAGYWESYRITDLPGIGHPHVLSSWRCGPSNSRPSVWPTIPHLVSMYLESCTVFCVFTKSAFICRPHIRRRALLVYCVLSKQDPDILRHVGDKTRKRLEDSDSIVICAALTLASELVSVCCRILFDKCIAWYLQTGKATARNHLSPYCDQLISEDY